MTRTMTPGWSAGHGSSSSDDGFTLAESIVALALFMIVITFGSIALVQTIKLTGVTSAKVGAANIATQEIERLRLENLTGHDPVLTPPEGEVPASFRVTDTAGDCTAGVKALTVTVTWGDGSRTVTYDTELAC